MATRLPGWTPRHQILNVNVASVESFVQSKMSKNLQAKPTAHRSRGIRVVEKQRDVNRSDSFSERTQPAFPVTGSPPAGILIAYPVTIMPVKTTNSWDCDDRPKQADL